MKYLSGRSFALFGVIVSYVFMLACMCLLLRAVMPITPNFGAGLVTGLNALALLHTPYWLYCYFTRKEQKPNAVMYAHNLSRFWKETYPEGMTQTDINNELHDLERLIENVSIVYDHVSGGRVSKPLTDPQYVIDFHEELIEQARKEGASEERGEEGIDDETFEQSQADN